jgi:hypothetical protein
MSGVATLPVTPFLGLAALVPLIGMSFTSADFS